VSEEKDRQVVKFIDLDSAESGRRIGEQDATARIVKMLRDVLGRHDEAHPEGYVVAHDIEKCLDSIEKGS